MTTPDRELIRDILAGWPVGSGYYSTRVATDEAGEMADEIAPLLAEARRKSAEQALRDAAKLCRDLSKSTLSGTTSRAWQRAEALIAARADKITKGDDE